MFGATDAPKVRPCWGGFGMSGKYGWVSPAVTSREMRGATDLAMPGQYALFSEGILNV